MWRIVLFLTFLTFISCERDDFDCTFETSAPIEIWQDDQRQPDCVNNYNFTNQTQNNIQVIDHSGCLLDIVWLGGGTVESIAVGWNENGVMQGFQVNSNKLGNVIIERECIRVMVKIASGQQYAETFHGNNQ